MVLVSINGAPLSKRDNTCAAVLRALAEAPYPATLTFRNLAAFTAVEAALSRCR
jgi:hypothetical protein